MPATSPTANTYKHILKMYNSAFIKCMHIY